MKTFRNANFTKRSYDCVDIVACQAEQPPASNGVEWVEADESILAGLHPLWRQAGAMFYGHM